MPKKIIVETRPVWVDFYYEVDLPDDYTDETLQEAVDNNVSEHRSIGCNYTPVGSRICVLNEEEEQAYRSIHSDTDKIRQHLSRETPLQLRRDDNDCRSFIVSINTIAAFSRHLVVHAQSKEEALEKVQNCTTGGGVGTVYAHMLPMPAGMDFPITVYDPLTEVMPELLQEQGHYIDRDRSLLCMKGRSRDDDADDEVVAESPADEQPCQQSNNEQVAIDLLRRWEAQYSARARKEGWYIRGDDRAGIVSIVSVADPSAWLPDEVLGYEEPLFESDEDAIAFVRASSDPTDPTDWHTQAIRIHDARIPY